jgi:hypothetical protein
MVPGAINHSTAKRFADDPVSTLLGLDHQKLQDRANYRMRDGKKGPSEIAGESASMRGDFATVAGPY